MGVSRNGDVALEFELFKSRLSGSIEYFDRRSSNLLFSIRKHRIRVLPAHIRMQVRCTIEVWKLI